MKLKAAVIAHLPAGHVRLAIYAEDPRNKYAIEDMYDQMQKNWSFDMSQDAFLSLGFNSPRLFPNPPINTILDVEIEDGQLITVYGNGLDLWRRPDYSQNQVRVA